MVAFPNCKINLGLNVLTKRADGYHDLETIFYPVPLHDIVEINEGDVMRFTTSGLKINGKEADNLCLKAYYLLKNDFENLPPVHIHLHKVIPMGAGLGGGSSDGAATLMLLNKKFQLNIATHQLEKYALQLGSDCPFFIRNQPCFAHGRGEELSPVSVDLAAYKIVLVYPNIHISTAGAFASLNSKRTAKNISDVIKKPVTSWKNDLVNDFEDAVFQMHPEIKSIKLQLYDLGADYAAMSGSGSTVFGLFANDEIDLSSLKKFYKVYVV